jgi:D-glycero-beta-D-manno-heptose 1-phosphate adenylyltransferase
MGEIVTLDLLIKNIQALKSNNKTIVTTNGCFDILHVGHVRYLKQSKALGDVLVVCVNSDSSVKRLKGPERPLNNQADRAEVLAALESVDYVVIFDEDTPVNNLSAIKPDIHTKGGDYDINSLPEAKVVMENGGRLEFISLVEGKSTTNIIEKSRK